MGRVHVPDLKARAFARQTAGAKRGNAALVRDFGQGIVLIHELGQLGGAKELLNRRRHGLGVDHVLRHQPFGLSQGQTLLHGALHPNETHPELVFRHLAHGPHTTVAKVIDIVDHTLAIANGDQGLQHRDDVLIREHPIAFRILSAEAAVELHPAHARKVVAFAREEQVIKQVLRRFLGRRLPRAHHAVNFHQRLEAATRSVDAQGVADVGSAVEFVGVDRIDDLHIGSRNLIKDFRGHLGVALREHLATVFVDDILRERPTDEVLPRHVKALDAGLFEQAHMPGRNPATGFHNGLALLVLELEAGHVPSQAIGDQIEGVAILLDVEGIGVEEHRQNLFRVVTQGTHEHRRRQLSAAIDSHEHGVLRVEFEIEPGAAVGNHPSAVQQFPGGVRLAAVVIKEHAGGTVKLGNNDPLRPVNDKGAVFSHHGHFTHVDLLLLNLLDGLVARLLIIDDELDRYPQRHRVGRATENAFLNVKGRFAKAVADIIQRRVTRVAHNREDGFEGRVQAGLQTLCGRAIRLQEALVGLQLDREQERHVHNLGKLSKVLTNPLLLCERISHQRLPALMRKLSLIGQHGR